MKGAIGKVSEGVMDELGRDVDQGDPELPEIAEDRVPDIDQEVPTATYRDWDPKDTVIKSYAVGGSPDSVLVLHHGFRWAPSRDAARADAAKRFGRVVEANYVRGRAFFRVIKEKQ